MSAQNDFASPELSAQLRALAAGLPDADRLTALTAFVQGVDPRFATCMIWRRSPEGLSLVADIGEHREECPLPSCGGISQQAVETNQSVLVGNNKATERTIECYLFAGSEIAVPIPAPDGLAWGAIHIQSERIEAFTCADRKMLTEAADVIGEWLAGGG